MRTLVRACAVMMAATSCGHAYAQLMTTAEALEQSRTDPVALGMMIASGESYGWAILYSADAGGPKLFCQPDNLAITGGQYRAILETYAKAVPEISTYPLELGMLQ